MLATLDDITPLEFEVPPSIFDGVMSPCVDVDHLNSIMNADGVKEFMKLPDGASDLSCLIGKLLFLANDHGFLAIEQKARQCYMFHTAILPEHRGRSGYKLTRAACEYMFLNTDAVELHTFTPFDNPNAKPPKTFGFKHWFDNKDGEFYRVNIMDWARNAPNLVKWGEFFHNSLESAKNVLGSKVEHHNDDESNNRYAGLACGLIKNGNVGKGVWAYNHWAITAGYEPIELISSNPTVVFTGDAMIRVNGNKMEFLSCL
ncbi:MAG: hypothetical protein JKY52_08585 [Flavobacteriales bacterium]|nr:hypothetical protein [Flavobacteriales bacterium]